MWLKLEKGVKKLKEVLCLKANKNSPPAWGELGQKGGS